MIEIDIVIAVIAYCFLGLILLKCFNTRMPVAVIRIPNKIS